MRLDATGRRCAQIYRAGEGEGPEKTTSGLKISFGAVIGRIEGIGGLPALGAGGKKVGSVQGFA